MSHTPGPWRTFQYDNGAIEVGTNQRKIAEMMWTGRGLETDDEDRANARLIAAAPELLEGLKRAAELITERKDCTLNEMRHWQVAIAKAEGKA